VVVAAHPVTGESVSAAAGTDTALAATDSLVTVSGRAAFKDVKFTINQTKHLLNQAVSVTWTGAQPTRHAPSTYGGNYMQIMQCWGVDDGTHPENPGPPPEQCVSGAREAIYGGVSSLPFPLGSYVTQRIISNKAWDNFDPNVGVLDSRTGQVWRSFRAVDGKQVDAHLNNDFDPDLQGGVYWENPYFNIVTTNEIAGAPTGADGKGSALVEVTTGIESSGLGCGQQVEPTAGGGKRVPKCWLVVVPRGAPKDEDVGTPFEGAADQEGVRTSPLAPAQWNNRIAVPLDFTPVDTICSLSAEQRRLAGSELAAPAVSSWQPKLCENSALEPYVYGTINDAVARQQLVQAPPGAPGLVVVSRPIDQSQLDPDSPVVYAPLTLSGLVVAFNLERSPRPQAPADEKALATVPVAHLNLTPRLIAKLLTQSYTQQVDIEGASAGYAWEKGNPTDMSADPDFVHFNPEFSQIRAAFAKNFGGLVMPAGTSDVAQQLWSYVLADPEAKAWLDGRPDPWGMRANPVYATAASANSNGVPFGDPIPASFPKSDSHCFQGPPTGAQGDLVPPLLCGTDWVPYTESFRDAARIARGADDGSKTAINVVAQSVDQIWKRDVPQTPGSRSILALTDSASASRYGVQTASLSRAGDDGDARSFIAADAKGMAAGVDAMTPGSEQAVLEPDPKAAAPGAYPLTVLTYGAIKPLALDKTARDQYAAFVGYAATGGQSPGQDVGQLPPGYSPLPAALKTQAQNAAKAVRELTAGTLGDDATAAHASGDQPASAPTSSAGAGGAGRGSSALAVPTAISPIALRAPLRPMLLPKKASPRGVTPVLSVAATRFVLPVLGGVALLSALIALEITKRPRVVRGAATDVAPTDGPPTERVTGEERGGP
jgi:hypothetical protein